MTFVEFSWLRDEESVKTAVQETLKASGQLLKKHFSSNQLQRRIQSRDTLRLPLDLTNHLQINPCYEGPPTRILAETDSYIAVHKPPGLHTHPHLYSDKNTVLNFLVQEKIWAPLLVNEQNYDRGLLYRLDFETSGVLILAKSQRLLETARKEFSTQVKRKFYWAIVDGSFTAEGRHDHYFRASGAAGSKQKVFQEHDFDRQEGSLTVLKVAEMNGKSLLLVNLKTGLRHQIRAQLSHLGFPLVGDELYGGGAAPRLFLHALRYEWIDVVEDPEAELFGSFFDLNSALKMTHDMIGRF